MLKETDLEAVKEVAICLLKTPVIDTEICGLVSHPIFTSAYNRIKVGDDYEIKNILEDENAMKQAIMGQEEIIKSCKDALYVYYLFRSAYKMATLKFFKPYLCVKDFSKMLREAWILQDNPNQDPNVSIYEAVSMFRKAEPSYLMEEDELAFMRNMPDQFTIYRGLHNGGKSNGISWTVSLERARWFANRFGDDQGYVLSGNASKQDVLAYFKIEDEIVIQRNKIKDIHKI